MGILVFDIETVADVAAARHYHQWTSLSDTDVVQALYQLRRQENHSEFLPHYLHKIVCISVVYQEQNNVKLWSLGDKDSSEATLIEKFFHIIENRTPQLVSWNGNGFDLPVLHYRALLHGICAPRYFETGERQHEFKYNNYLNRYHYRHLDLMDTLAGYQSRAYASLDHYASMLGLPGKLGMNGSQVQSYYQNGQRADIRAYCETDVLNTYLVFLRFDYIRGKISAEHYSKQQEILKSTLRNDPSTHLHTFVDIWEQEQLWFNQTYGHEKNCSL